MLSHIASHQPSTIFIFDHLDRLSAQDLESLTSEIDKTSFPCILISRYPPVHHLFKLRESKLLESRTISLTLEEIEQIMVQSELDPAFASVLLSASQGNALKLRQMLVKLLGQISIQGELKEEYIKSMQALAASGGFPR